MRLGLVQYDIAWEDRAESRRRIEALLADAAGCDWLVFPEMALTGFSMDPSRTALGAADHAFFRDLAVRAGAAVTYGGVEDGRNCCWTLDAAGNALDRYAKMHLFSYAGEHEHYTPGQAETAFTLGGLRARPSICYDLRFSPRFWRNAPETDLFIIIANWPRPRRVHWRTLLQARAIENQAYVIGVNRVGNDPKLAYAGDSLVVSPGGEILLDCGDTAGLHCLDIDPAAVAQTRQGFPLLRDRIA